MLKNNYLSVAQFQLRLEIVCDSKNDTLTLTDEYYNQMDASINVIKKLKPDISIFPEMSYNSKYNDIFRKLSESGKMIVFGSTYVDGINKTIIYLNGKQKQVVKRYPCGSEPMIRICEKLDVNDFITRFLKEHEFYVSSQKVYVLNCLEYYQAAYMIARNRELVSDLFGFIVPCSNSNPVVFLEESKAIHNHNESIYSFVTNRVKEIGESGYGSSYVFGPIQYHEKDWLKEEGIISEEHNASILTMSSKDASYSYGRYATKETISRFGRSDLYTNTPKDIIVKNLI